MTPSPHWAAVRAALQDAADRFADLIDPPAGPGPDSGTRTDGTWTVGETAAHVAAIAWMDVGLLDPSSPPPPVPGFDTWLATSNVEGVHAFNETVLAAMPGRDLAVLAADLRERVKTMDALADGRDPAETVGWIGGARLPICGLFAHMVNELLLHGHDVARALGRPWTVPPRDASYFFEDFIVGLARNGVGALLDGGGPPREDPVVVEFRSAHTTPVTFVLRRGELSVEKPGRTPDVRLRFDPAAFTMMMFGRMSKPRALLTGRIRVGGRRPWLLPVFLRTVRVP
ncbi:hypothetical protein DZF91_29715 [Actinomadura logoneensis]|uniref:Maleylpyruvate isomerase family mycothiol-dependent enzyme n=1 Tax=Actinomadura logoneensis TaxID=2293572 RepID=A0A372JE08_9ACTN|nr:maleylpyruvate isomerase N-terminal domain-containing protein [Actinomadura logoneensis]RFU38046.1 hypothetical protein DZF91_29715 [Actinomadura logoneensis]